VDERVARLTKVLQLNEAQRSALKTILEQRRQEFWRIRHDPSLSEVSASQGFELSSRLLWNKSVAC
jgi:hypothetical protein